MQVQDIGITAFTMENGSDSMFKKYNHAVLFFRCICGECSSRAPAYNGCIQSSIKINGRNLPGKIMD